MTDSRITKWMARPGLSFTLRYMLAFISVIGALWLNILFQHLHVPILFSAFALSAIAITFWYGGTTPGIIATLLALVIRNRLFRPEVSSLPRVLYGLVFVVFAVLMGWLRRRRNALEAKITDRSAKLTAANENLRVAFEKIKHLKDQLHDENQVLKEQIDQRFMFEEIVGSSAALQTVLSSVMKVAPTNSTVLITGETGTGKELVARAIHKRSQRSEQPFIAVNCASIPSSLIASELFGHEKGAFTGAVQRRQGRFELAHSGTIFLDEIGDLPAETQSVLLRVLQESKFERVGGNQILPTDVRVIAATNQDLRAAVAAGEFRTDLFYRLNVFPIEVPPLRKRKDDIPLLVEYFVRRYAEKARKQIRKIDRNTLELCQAYSWPGNVRELQNIIERSVILCGGDTLWIDEGWLSSPSLPRPELSGALTETLQVREKEMIEAALAESRGRIAGPSGAAAKLGIPPSTLDSRIKNLNIDKNQFKFN